ncbi:MAG: hypothetical protein M1827_003397 [Pycnora praestabilis]|nr:MAG: hypothetical protein M1827_003397 [Pycnora praestabilis]
MPQGLRDPPAYSPPPSPRPRHATLAVVDEEELPAYSSLDSRPAPAEKASASSEPAQDVLHFLDPANDSLASLSLRYGVPINALRKTNGLYADHLLAARRTMLIPGEYYKGGISLNPQPLEGEEEELRKAKVRRWMVTCKVAEYDVATLYLKQSDYDLESAILAYKDDEKWEKEHPMDSVSKGKAKQSSSRRKYGIGSGLIGQLS